MSEFTIACVFPPPRAKEGDDSLPPQVRDLTEIAEANGWQIERTCQDSGITGETLEG